MIYVVFPTEIPTDLKGPIRIITLTKRFDMTFHWANQGYPVGAFLLDELEASILSKISGIFLLNTNASFFKISP